MVSSQRTRTRPSVLWDSSCPRFSLKRRRMMHGDAITRENAGFGDIVYSIAASSPTFARDGVCFTGRRSGLYRSEDGGITWQPTYDLRRFQDREEPLTTNISVILPEAVTNLPDGAIRTSLMTTAVVVSPHFADDSSVFAGVKGGILCSTDAGNKWTKLAITGLKGTRRVNSIEPSRFVNGRCYVVLDGHYYNSDAPEVWATEDFGKTEDTNHELRTRPPRGHRKHKRRGGTGSGLRHDRGPGNQPARIRTRR